jgi:hypothetical protein
VGLPGFVQEPCNLGVEARAGTVRDRVVDRRADERVGELERLADREDRAGGELVREPAGLGLLDAGDRCDVAQRELAARDRRDVAQRPRRISPRADPRQHGRGDPLRAEGPECGDCIRRPRLDPLVARVSQQLLEVERVAAAEPGASLDEPRLETPELGAYELADG